MKRSLRTLLDRSRIDAEMEEEMRHHLELEVESLVRAGATPADARKQAAISFGGIVQQREQAIDESRVAWLIHLRRDVRIGLRNLYRHRTFAITAMLTLALAIAVNTSTFSLLDAMVNPDYGIADADNVFQLRYFGDVKEKVDFREQTDAINAAGALFARFTQYTSVGPNTFQRGARQQDGTLGVVRPNFFEFLGVKPLEGGLTPRGDRTAQQSAIVISDRLASAMFASGEHPVGATIVVNDTPKTVIGIAAQTSSSYGMHYDAWIFADAGTPLNGARLIRLVNGSTKAEAEAKLAGVATQLARAAGKPERESRFSLQPLGHQFSVNQFHYALIGAGIAILLVACTNLANIQLARGLGRSGELAVRAALGATHRQLVTQLSIESGVLAIGALVLALVLSIAGNGIIRATVPETFESYVVKPHSSWRMVGFAGVAAAICVLMIGLIPALRLAKVDLNALMKSRAGTGAHKTNRRVYGMLVIVQIAFTLPLVCAAILTTRAAAQAASTSYLVREYFGYDPTPLITARLIVPVDTATALTPTPIAEAFVARVRAANGVATAAAARYVRTDAITIDGPDGAFRVLPTPMWSYTSVTPAFFRTMGLPIVEGSDFIEGGRTEPAVIIDRETANYLWPGLSAVGRRIRFGDNRSTEPFIRIQGVSDDYASPEAHDRRRQMRQSRLAMVYRTMTLADTEPRSKYGIQVVSLTVRGARDPAAVTYAVRNALRNGTVRPPAVFQMEESLGIRRQRIVTRFIAGLFSTFGLLALGLSALGVYAIVAQSVADRKREVAVRMSLGATPQQIIHALLREGNVLVLAGVAIGLFMAKQTISWLGAFLTEFDLTNAPLFAVICAALFATLVAAALVPAFVATKLDPMIVLRAE